jgi:hypothetical protein
MYVKAAATTLFSAVALAAPPMAAADSQAAWQRALAVRSDALNRQYHLGQYAVPRALTAPTTPAWLAALEARSRALNARYGLGPPSATPAADGFHWGDAGIGAVCAAAVSVLIAGRTRIGLRRPRLS